MLRLESHVSSLVLGKILINLISYLFSHFLPVLLLEIFKSDKQSQMPSKVFDSGRLPKVGRNAPLGV